MECGGSAPRVLSLDDYFMTEVEKVQKDPESGKKVMRKVSDWEALVLHIGHCATCI